MLLKKYGFADIHIGDDRYRVAPTFINIAKLGEPKEIVECFVSFVSETSTAWRYTKAVDILNACCEPKLPESLTGRSKFTGGKLKLVNPPPIEIINDIIVLAEHCLKHGIIGPVDETGGSGEAMKEFDPYEFIELAVEHLGRSTGEAGNMTMTQFVRAMRTKFPELTEKKQKEFTKDELDWYYEMCRLDEERAAKAAL